MTLLIFILILSILILVHEWGHYITAIKCGVRVEQFALGFGPKLFSWKKGDTEFCLCAIPLGGFVKMAGDERDKSTGLKGEFFAASLGHRALIVIMGPVVNIILAFVCFYIVFLIGFVNLEKTANQVSAVIGQIVDHSPAMKAGLKVGDQVVAINGKSIEHWPELQQEVSASSSVEVTVDIIREGQRQSVVVHTDTHEQKDIFGRVHTLRRMGVAPQQATKEEEFVIERYGPLGAFKRAAFEMVDITMKTYKALGEMLLGMRSPKEAMGIVGMFFVIKFALSYGFAFVLHILGVISLSLAIFNLLPIIPLDGGHLLLNAIEKIRGKALSVKIENMIAKVGLGLMLALALFVFYADFERIGLIDKVIKIFNGGH